MGGAAGQGGGTWKLFLSGGHLGRKMLVASAVWLGGEGARVGRGLPRSTGVGEAGGKGFLSFGKKKS